MRWKHWKFAVPLWAQGLWCNQPSPSSAGCWGLLRDEPGYSPNSPFQHHCAMSYLSCHLNTISVPKYLETQHRQGLFQKLISLQGGPQKKPHRPASPCPATACYFLHCSSADTKGKGLMTVSEETAAQKASHQHRKQNTMQSKVSVQVEDSIYRACSKE